LGWLASHDVASSGDALESILASCPELLERYRDFYGVFWDEELLPARLLELCRLRIASLNRCEAESAIAHSESGVTRDERECLSRGEIPSSASDLEKRALGIATRVPFEIHALEDGEVEALRRDLGDDGVVALMVALPLFDANCRLRLVLEVEPETHEVDRPASRHGRLY